MNYRFKEKIGRNKAVLINFVRNIIASAMTIGISQLVIYPFFALYLGSEKYGVLLSVIGIANALAGTAGGTVNNLRLLKYSEIEKNELKKACNVILFIVNIIVSIIFIIYYEAFIGEACSIEFVLTLAYIVVFSLRLYEDSEFRIQLQYKNILLESVSVVCGNVAGMVIYVIFFSEKCWAVVFLIGEILGFFYVEIKIKKTRTIFSNTYGLSELFKQEAILFISAIIINALNYLDRLFLLPMLGGEFVSIYSVASFLGKSVALIVAPVSGVLLTYFSQEGYIYSYGKKNKILCTTVVLCSLAYIFCFVFGKKITSILYPTIVYDAEKYMIIANLAAIVSCASTMLYPIIMKFGKTKWQLYIQFGYGLIYVFWGYIGIIINGLYGFIVAIVFANAAKLLILIFLSNRCISVAKKGYSR